MPTFRWDVSFLYGRKLEKGSNLPKTAQQISVKVWSSNVALSDT